MLDFMLFIIGLAIILWRLDIMASEAQAAFERLTNEVAETKTANESLRTAFNGLAAQLRESANDPAAINALADSLDSDQALTNAVLAGTPAEAVANDTNADIAEEATGDEAQG